MPPTNTGSSSTEPSPAAAGTVPDDFVGFYDASASEWVELKPNAADTDDGTEDAERKKAAQNQRALNDFLSSSLHIQHLMVLAGSGTSLGPTVMGPSMWDLWRECVFADPEEADPKKQKRSALASKAIDAVKFDAATKEDDRNKDNIEALLSRCDAYLQIHHDDTEDVDGFVSHAKGVILDKCRGFLPNDAKDQLQAHRTFLHRLSRRRVRDSRLKLFTTNYDLCFESAAALQGVVSLDGFSFSQPRRFDPRFYTYDIVRRSQSADDFGTPLEGVFLLYKLHGSVNWVRSEDDVIATNEATAESVSMIFPAAGKYQQSYIQPHLELMSQYLSSLREPNTCLIVAGFGFNDDHLSEPLLAAVRTNPHLRLIVVSPTLTRDVENKTHRYWKPLFELAKAGHDIRLINATFQQFAELIPDLRSLSPAEQLSLGVQRIAASS